MLARRERDRSTRSEGRRRRSALLLGAALILSAIQIPAGATGPCLEPAHPGGDWPVFHHDVMATGNQDLETTIGVDNVDQLEIAWAAPLSGSTNVSVTAAGGCVFAGGANVRAFDIDTGEMVWQASVGTGYEPSVANGKVFVQNGTAIWALDQSTGEIVWETHAQALQPYSMVSGGSPLPFGDGFVMVGFTGCGEGGAGRAENPGCRGYYAILDQVDGSLVVGGYDVSDADVARGMEGAGFWARPGYDPEDKYIYFGEAGPRSIKPQNPYADAMLKIDADPSRETFGEIVDYFRDTALNPLNSTPVPHCGREDPIQEPNAFVSVCLDDDDFVTTPVIFRDSDGNKRLAMNHSQSPLPVRNYNDWVMPWGSFMSVDPEDMNEVWRAPATGARGTLHAYDGTKLYYSSGHEGGIIAVDKDTGTIRWRSDSLGGNTWMHVSTANGVVYAISGNRAVIAGNPGLLMAFDAANGLPLLARPLTVDVGGAIATGALGAGVTIARNTVLVPTNVAASSSGANAFVVAYRLPS